MKIFCSYFVFLKYIQLDSVVHWLCIDDLPISAELENKTRNITSFRCLGLYSYAAEMHVTIY